MTEDRRTVRWPLKVWWWIHVVLISLWCFPHAPPAVQNNRASGTPVDQVLKFNDEWVRGGLPRYYIEPIGLWQYWDMFAPDPLRKDYYFDAVVQYRDGTTKTVDFPRVNQMPLFQKYYGERFRKYGERVQDAEYQYLWPTWAQWIAEQASSDPANPVVGLNLQKRVREVPGPSPSLDMNRPFETVMFHPQMVDQTRLAQDKGWNK